METAEIIMYAAIFVVLAFDYTNGFHDASNIIGTMIASRAMTPVASVIIVGTFEMIGPFAGGTAVANTIGKFITIDDLEKTISMTVVMWGIFGAIFWNLLTWWFGMPSSSSHALVGGLAGAVLMAAGPDHVHWGIEAISKGKMDGVTKVVLSLILSPIAGFWVGFFLNRLVSFLLIAATPSVNKYLRGAQYISAASMALAHGSNDAQKSMGVVALLLFLGGVNQLNAKGGLIVDNWVILACAVCITLGIMSGGWRIVRTVGFGIYKVRPKHAFNAQLTSGTLIFSAAVWGFPVSTTHVASSAIMGVGASERPKSVRWAKAKEIVSTWIFTIPGSGAVSALTYWIFNLFANMT